MSRRAWLWAPFVPLLECLLSIRKLNDIYAGVHAQLEHPEDDPAFFMKTLRLMRVHFELENTEFDRIPKEGPILVVANHPFGGIDGVVLGALLKGLRKDTKLMGNYLLANMEGIRGSIIRVDPFGGTTSARANLAGMRQAIRFLKEGGCLGAFPAGKVSSFNLKSRTVVDTDWSSHIAQLAAKTGAPILPIYFEGRNSIAFHLIGLIHPRLRTALLVKEFCGVRDTEIRLKVGHLIDPEQLDQFESIEAATEYLRLKTYALKDLSKRRSHKRLRLPFRSTSVASEIHPLAPAQPTRLMVREVEALPLDNHLVEHGDFKVYWAGSDKIPVILKEIGRLREETFRAVQEGTGKATDVDDFDAYYLHLFMWNHVEKEIVGAYRIGRVDKIVEKFGKQGLYTSTLFRYGSKFLEKLGPSIELGRSFIRLKYQKKQMTLALIWRGIGEYVARHPECRTLFGPVSITDAYHNISKDLMVRFFREHNFDPEMSRYVKARNSPKLFKSLNGISLKNIGESINSVESVSAIVSTFEKDRKGVPVLLKHYIKLNGTLVSFNVDPVFSGVIDGLIIVDLCKSDPKILQRYLGKQGYKNFMDYNASGLKSNESKIESIS